MTTATEYSQNTGPTSLAGVMSKSAPQTLIASHQLTLFAEDTLASLSPLQGNSRPKKTRATSGPTSVELSLHSGPLGACLKMLQTTFDSDSNRYALTWKKRVMKSNRVLFRLWPSMRSTNETEFGLLPTPTAQDSKNATLPPSQLMRDSIPGLLLRGLLFPTPSTGAPLCGGTRHFNQLKTLAAYGIITEEERRSFSQGNGGHTNPEFMEWLMGFPTGHTELTPAETP